MLVLSDSSGNQVGLRFLDGAVLPVRHLKLPIFQRKVIPLLTAKLNHPLNKAYNSLSLPTKTNKHNSSRPKQVSKNHQSGKPEETTNKVIRVKERESARTQAGIKYHSSPVSNKRRNPFSVQLSVFRRTKLDKLSASRRYNN